MPKTSLSLMHWIIALTAIFFALPAWSQQLPQYRCLECRNIQQYPEDARNFSVNLLYGPGSSLGFDQTLFSLSDPFGNTITVDINGDYIMDPINWGMFDDLMVVDILIQVVLIFPNGDVITYKMTTEMLNPDENLPVPAQMPAPESRTDAGGNGPGSGGGVSPDDSSERDDYDENMADWEEAWGYPACWADFSSPYETTVICNAI